MEKDRSIALVGFMGSGKTTVGGLLAKELGFKFVDLDGLIEKTAGKTIAVIFKESGEDYFRNLESMVLEKTASLPDAVVACGGGIVEKRSNRKTLKDNFFVVHLNAPSELCYRRIKGDTLRPKAGLSKDELEKLYERRKPLYLEVAHLVIDVQNKDPESIVKEIKRELQVEKG